MSGLRNYTRWRTDEDGRLTADLLGGSLPTITALPSSGRIALDGTQLSPYEARLIGVRLIEAAAVADGDRAIRTPAPAAREAAK